MARTKSPKAMKKAGGAQNRNLGDVSLAKKKTKKKRQESFSVPIFKVLKGINPAMQISKTGISVMNCFVNDIFHRIADEASRLMKYSKKKTLSDKDIEAATKLVLNGELANHAVEKGRKALQRFEEDEDSA